MKNLTLNNVRRGQKLLKVLYLTYFIYLFYFDFKYNFIEL